MSRTSENVASPPSRFVGPGPVAARELREKVPAAPVSLDSADRVEEIVKLTGDVASRARFRQLLEIVKKNKRGEEWDAAYNATKTALEGRTRVERPGAYFHAILVTLLEKKGVRVPMGSRQERADIRKIIAKSLNAAGGG